MVVPTVRSLTEMPIIRPSVNSEFISGWPHSVSCSQKCAVDVQRLRVQRHVGEQHVVHLRHGARERVLVEVADHEIVEIDAAALVATDRGVWSHGLPPRRCGAKASRTMTPAASGGQLPNIAAEPRPSRPRPPILSRRGPGRGSPAGAQSVADRTTPDVSPPGAGKLASSPREGRLATPAHFRHSRNLPSPTHHRRAIVSRCVG